MRRVAMQVKTKTARQVVQVNSDRPSRADWIRPCGDSYLAIFGRCKRKGKNSVGWRWDLRDLRQDGPAQLQDIKQTDQLEKSHL